MNTKLTSRSICLFALGGWAALASALSLGPVSGTTVIGRPLELIAPIQFDELSQGNSAGCVSAQVMYGDRVVEQAQVDVELGADPARQPSYARISSSVPVDEPFVSVVVNAGCGRSFSKRYVLLSEAPSQEPLVLAAVPSLGAVAPRPLPLASIAAVEPRATRTAGVRLAGAAPRTERPASVRRVAAIPREAPVRSPSRLQLAVWDPATEQLPWLRTSTELKSSPTADAARRAAATSLWRALNAQPQDLLRTAERLRGLESEMSSLRALSSRHQSDIASARDALQSTRQRDHTSLLVVVLLSVVAGSAVAWGWHRSRRPYAGVADSWYGPLEPWSDSAAADASTAEPVAAPQPIVRTAPQEPAPPLEVPPLPEALPFVQPRPVEAFEPMLPPFEFAAAKAPPTATLITPTPERPGLKVEALQAAQQQSEFFASLGQVDEAVVVLTSYLEESSERPPLAYLELLRIYHGTGMRAEYEALQLKFRQVFGMDAVGFDQYTDEARELDLYLLPVTRISSCWPSERSLEIIEELLFKRPATPRELLSLDAYRDLLWLYALGQDVVHNTSTPAGLQLLGDSGLPNDHFILPWADGERDEPTELSLDRLDNIDVAPDLSAFGVDIDLTAIRGDGRPANDQVHDGAPPAAPPRLPDPEADAFDAAMASESRRSR